MDDFTRQRDCRYLQRLGIRIVTPPRPEVGRVRAWLELAGAVGLLVLVCVSSPLWLSWLWFRWHQLKREAARESARVRP